MLLDNKWLPFLVTLLIYLNMNIFNKIIFIYLMSLMIASDEYESQEISLIYYSQGSSIEDGENINTDTPWTIGGTFAIESLKLSVGFDIGSEGTSLSSLYGQDNVPIQSTSMSLIILKKIFKKSQWRIDTGALIGFRDESWESILRTKEFAKELFAEGLDSAGFAIPVPYPGTLDFEHEMKNPDLRKKFNENLLDYTDQMHTRGLPLFGTKVPGEKLRESVKEFWLELNSSDHVKASKSVNVEQSLTH